METSSSLLLVVTHGSPRALMEESSLRGFPFWGADLQAGRPHAVSEGRSLGETGQQLAEAVGQDHGGRLRHRTVTH